MRGLLLACGSGSRLLPLNTVNSEQFLPAYDRLLIHQPPSVLMSVGVREIPGAAGAHLDSSCAPLGDGGHLGPGRRDASRDEPCGIAGAVPADREFAGGQDVCLSPGGQDLLLPRPARHIARGGCHRRRGHCLRLPGP